VKVSGAEPISVLLRAWGEGDEGARDRLFALLYNDLRKRAGRLLRRERHHSLQTTALVHEAYVRMVSIENVSARHRGQFLALACQVMRNVLVDEARMRRSTKRGGGAVRVSLVEDAPAVAARELDVLMLDEALRELSALDPEHGRLVELRHFGGLSIEETAEVLGVSPATVKREWSVARAWLYRRLRGDPGAGRPAS
jgi:RNA polymerase sigma factor (TIGR02999 family)